MTRSEEELAAKADEVTPGPVALLVSIFALALIGEALAVFFPELLGLSSSTYRTRVIFWGIGTALLGVIVARRLWQRHRHRRSMPGKCH